MVATNRHAKLVLITTFASHTKYCMVDVVQILTHFQIGTQTGKNVVDAVFFLLFFFFGLDDDVSIHN